MTIILRLQGLDVKAGPEDIRKFFDCLHIPDGGVYIVGGNRREAFIAFTNERDGQLAMRHTGSFLKGSKVTLYISSMAELELKIKSKLKEKKASPPQLPVMRPQPPANATPPPSNANPPPSNAQLSNPDTALLFGLVTLLQGLQPSQQREHDVAPTVDCPKADSTAVVSDKFRTPEEALKSRPGYVRLFGLPASVTKVDICHFFKGLQVQEVIVNVMLGLSRGCLVKFANFQDGGDALQFNNRQLGPNCVEVRGASEKMWTSAVKECENSSDFEVADIPDTQDERKTRLSRDPRKPRQGPLVETALHKQRSTSTVQNKRRSEDSMLLKSRKKPRYDCASTTGVSPTMEYYVMVNNLAKNMTKTEIKELFRCPKIPHHNIQHLLDQKSNRTKTAFVIFQQAEDYDYAMNLNGCHVASEAIEVSSVTRERMEAMLASGHAGHQQCLNSRKNTRKKRRERSSRKRDLMAKTCLYVRNMLADVQKINIRDFFCKYNLREDKIILLHDSDGNGIGEAVIQFKSQKLSALAQRLHGQVFMGTEVLLTCISVNQMKDILTRNLLRKGKEYTPWQSNRTV